LHALRKRQILSRENCFPPLQRIVSSRNLGMDTLLRQVPAKESQSALYIVSIVTPSCTPLHPSPTSEIDRPMGRQMCKDMLARPSGSPGLADLLQGIHITVVAR